MNENNLNEEFEIFTFDPTSNITKCRQIYNFIWATKFHKKSMKDFEYQLVLEVIEQFENMSDAMAFDIISVYSGDTIKEFPNYKLICETLCIKNIMSINKSYFTNFKKSKIYFYANEKKLFMDTLFTTALNTFSLSSINKQFNIMR